MSYENLLRFIFLNTRQKEALASIEQDATLAIDSAIRPPQLDRLEPCWSMIQVYWLRFLPFSLLVTSTSLIARAIACEGRREDNDPL